MKTIRLLTTLSAVTVAAIMTSCLGKRSTEVQHDKPLEIAIHEVYSLKYMAELGAAGGVQLPWSSGEFYTGTPDRLLYVPEDAKAEIDSLLALIDMPDSVDYLWLDPVTRQDLYADYPYTLLFYKKRPTIQDRVNSFKTDTTYYPEISLQLNEEAAKKLDSLTGENIGRELAISLNGKIVSVPKVAGRISGGAISVTFSDNNTFHDIME